MKIRKIKHLPLISICILGLTACGSETTPNTQKLTQNVQMVSSSTVIMVTAEDSYQVPVDGQIIEQSGRYKVIYDIYNESNDRILIPSGAIVSGIYVNDGVSCKVMWKSVYANNDENEDYANSVSLSQATMPSKCNPDRGIKYGDHIKINFIDGTN